MSAGKPAMLLGDFETTGLDSHSDHVLEFAAVLLDRGLEVVAEFDGLVVNPLLDDPRALDGMVPYVRSMHESNGLLDESAASSLRTQDLDDALVGFLSANGVEPPSSGKKVHGLLFAGSSCRLDMQFLERHLPRSAERMSYRMHDVSGMREGLEAYAPHLVPAHHYQRLNASGAQSDHRAMGDVLSTLAEMRAWRDALAALKPPF